MLKHGRLHDMVSDLDFMLLALGVGSFLYAMILMETGPVSLFISRMDLYTRAKYAYGVEMVGKEDELESKELS
jgi:hypothetical protein